MILKIILLSLVGITALYAIFSAINCTLYQHRVVKVDNRKGKQLNTYYKIQKRFLLFFWKDVLLPSVGRSYVAFGSYYEALLSKIVEFKDLQTAKDAINRMNMCKHRNTKIYKIYDYQRDVYKGANDVNKYYETAWVLVDTRMHLKKIFTYLIDAKDFIDSQITITTKTVVFP